MMKYRIERNTVQETLLIPLYSRMRAAMIFPDVYEDETAQGVIDRIDYDFSSVKKAERKTLYRFGFLEVAMRQNDLAAEIKDYLASHPAAAVVNLGCGLDDTGKRCDNGECTIYNIDFENVMEIRNALLPPGEREENIACDLNDLRWFDRIDASGGAVFFASGVFYYFLKEQVKSLTERMAERFPGGRLMFDGANKNAVKMIAKTWLKTAKIKDVGAYFAVSDAKKELTPWSDKIIVSSKGYMLGYNDLKGKSVGPLFRMLAKFGDKMMKMQIVRIDFRGMGR